MNSETQLAVILHADIVDSTHLVQVDERLAHEQIRDALRRLADAVTDGGGRTHEIRGDALVAEFHRAFDAVMMALAFQASERERPSTKIRGLNIHLRMGIALGEVVIADNTLTGAGVVLAHRIEQLATPGGVCLSAAVREAVPERVAIDFHDIGEQRLKGFDRPQRVFADWQARSHARVDFEPRLGAELLRTGAQERPSIAVFPFEKRSDAPDGEFLADGLTEDITTTLSYQRWLIVIARASAVDVASRMSEPRKVSEALGVRFLLTGGVRQSGRRVRVTATLTEPGSGRQIWSNRYDRVAEDIFDLQDEIARSIVAELVPEITGADLSAIAGIAPQNLSAWEAYQRGIAELYHQSAESYQNASTYFQAAISHDPTFSSAYAMYGYAIFRQLLWRLIPLDRITELSSVADKAADLDPRDSNAHVVLGLAQLLRREAEDAIREMDLALTLNPSAAFALLMRASVGTFANVSHEIALQDLQALERLSPTDRFDRGQRMATAAFANFCLGAYENAARAGEESWRAGGMFGGLIGAVAHMGLGNSERGQEFVREILAGHPNMSIAFCQEAFFYMPPNPGIEKLGRPRERRTPH